MFVKIIYCQYYDQTFSGKGVYLTVYPLSCPNTDTVGADRMGEGGGGRNILAIQILLLLIVSTNRDLR